MSAINRAARIGPMEGIWQRSFDTWCFPLSANSSRRTCWRKVQRIELLVVNRCSATHSSLGNLAEPLGTIARRIDLFAGTRDSPASIQRLEARHDSNQISADRQVTSRQFLERPHSVLSVIDRVEKIGPQQIG